MTQLDVRPHDVIGSPHAAPHTLTAVLPDDGARRQVADAMNEGVLIQNAAGRIVWFNSAVSRLLDVSADQLIGRTWPEIGRATVNRDGTPLRYEDQPAAQTSRTGEAIYGSLVGLDGPNGTRTWLTVDARPVIRDGEQMVVSLFNDVSAKLDRQIELEEAMRQIREATFQTALPRTGQISFASKSRPAGATEQAGRDFCGAFQLDATRWEFFLGTIGGSQTQAVGASSFTCHTLRTAGTLLHDPDDVLGHLDGAIEAEWPEVSVEAIFGYVDLTAGSAEVRMSRAGLNAPQLISGAGARRIGVTGGPMGSGNNQRRPAESLSMCVGDRLVLVTGDLDGCEAFDGDEDVPTLRAHRSIDETVEGTFRIASEASSHHAPAGVSSVLAIGIESLPNQSR